MISVPPLTVELPTITGVHTNQDLIWCGYIWLFGSIVGSDYSSCGMPTIIVMRKMVSYSNRKSICAETFFVVQICQQWQQAVSDNVTFHVV